MKRKKRGRVRSGDITFIEHLVVRERARYFPPSVLLEARYDENVYCVRRTKTPVSAGEKEELKKNVCVGDSIEALRERGNEEEGEIRVYSFQVVLRGVI